MNLALLAVLLLAGCGVGPQLGLAHPTDRPAIVGEWVILRWGVYAPCTTEYPSSHGTVETFEHECEVKERSEMGLFDWLLHDPNDARHLATLKVSCSPECTIAGSDASEGLGYLGIMPRQPGKLTVSAALTDEHTGKRTSRSFTVKVARPTIAMCPMTREGECAGARTPLDPRDPLFKLTLRLGKHAVSSSLLRINGMPGPGSDLPAFDGTIPTETIREDQVSLKTLFPDSVQDGVLRPGIYKVVVELGPQRVEQELWVGTSRNAP